MSFVQELDHLFEVKPRKVNGTNYLHTSSMNRFWEEHHRHDEIAACIESSDIEGLWLDEAPVSAQFGRRVSPAFESKSYITEIRFSPRGVAMRDLIDWFSKELQVIYFNYGPDHVMSALARFLAGSSLVNFILDGGRIFSSQAAFNFLCDCIAESKLQKLTLGYHIVEYANLETAAESLARAIVESSSLEEVTIMSVGLCSALKRTASVRNLDFALSQIGNDATRLRINRKWKPLLNAKAPLGLWPQILEKSHFETISHSPEDILFFFLREKPDLVPRK